MSSNKAALREILRQRRRGLSTGHQSSAAQSVALLAQTLPGWDTFQHIALYRDTDGEIGTGQLIRMCLAQGKSIFLPVVAKSRRLEFANWSEGEPLEKSTFGIAEPRPDAQRCEPANLDVLFVPLVGWDRAGNRLGMGGGYYDQTLEGVKGPVLIGLGHSAQEMKSIPSDSWDVKLDYMLTETELHVCPAVESRVKS